MNGNGEVVTVETCLAFTICTFMQTEFASEVYVQRI